MTGPKVTVIEDAEIPTETVKEVTVEILTFPRHWCNSALTAGTRLHMAVRGVATGAAVGYTTTACWAALSAHAPEATATSASHDTIAMHGGNLLQMNYVAGHQAWTGTT